MSVSIAGGFLNDALKKFEQQVSQPEAAELAAEAASQLPIGTPGQGAEPLSPSLSPRPAAELAAAQLPTITGSPRAEIVASLSPRPAAEAAAEQLGAPSLTATELGAASPVALRKVAPLSKAHAEQPTEQPAELAAEAAELAKVSQLSDDLLHHMLESISDSTDSALLPKVLSNTQKNISDDDNYLLSFKQYTNAEQYTDYTIYYKDNDEALNTGTNFLDKSFNYFVYSPDGTNVKITPIKKYYTLNDILKHICNLFDNIIIISKKISSSPISVLYQYKDYKHKSLIFIYNSTNNDIFQNIRGFIDIIPENTRPDNPITIDEYNSIKTEIYNE